VQKVGVRSLKAKLFVCEAGVALLDEAGTPLASYRFQGDMYEKYSSLMSGRPVEELSMILEHARANGVTDLENPYEEVSPALGGSGLNILSSPDKPRMEAEKEEIMLRSGLVFSRDEILDVVREFAIKKSESRLRERAAKPDLQIVQSIMAVDELDKIVNLMSARVREWYGLHFPELDALLQDPVAYCKTVVDFGRRENITPDALEAAGVSKAKSEAIVEAASKSKGGTVSDEDIAPLITLAESTVSLYKLRERLMKHVEKNMKLLAPNLTEIVGPAIGARLIAKVGSLQRLAMLPSSTIQVLGAEKALFRSMKTGGRPPKHGLIFQHTLVHAAPSWQRGKVARVLASKIALAARMDYFRGEKYSSLNDDMTKRIEEIKKKYPQPRIQNPRRDDIAHARRKHRGNR
jgi:nucleolar protein 56